MEKVEKSNNSSIDSFGEDLSFEEEINAQNGGIGNYLSFEDFKMKKENYENNKERIYKNMKESESKKSLWGSIYHFFFNSNIKNNIKLNELKLRCKMILRKEDINKKDNKSFQTKKKNSFTKNSSHVDLYSFICKYSEKPKKCLFGNIFQQKDSKSSSNKINQINLFKILNVPSLNFNGNEVDIKNNSPDDGFLSVLKREIDKNKNLKSTRILNESNIIEKGEKQPQFNKNQFLIRNESDSIKSTIDNNRFQSHETKLANNLFTMYGIKDAHKMIKLMNLDNSKESKNKKNSEKIFFKNINDLENLNAMLSNKSSFRFELDRYSDIFQRKRNQTIEMNSIKSYEHLLEFRDASYFYENLSIMNITSLDKLVDTPRINRISMSVNGLCNKIIDKIDVNKKLDFKD